MRIASWNVNSIKKHGLGMVEYCKAGHTDVLLLQELKMMDEAFPHDAFQRDRWHVANHGQKNL